MFALSSFFIQCLFTFDQEKKTSKLKSVLAILTKVESQSICFIGRLQNFFSTKSILRDFGLEKTLSPHVSNSYLTHRAFISLDVELSQAFRRAAFSSFDSGGHFSPLAHVRQNLSQENQGPRHICKIEVSGGHQLPCQNTTKL